ncbi:DNA cytosine methyltransferase, partial [Salmonella enterica subsp. enterica serovar Anatum]|nr:DNA cytosine methyltransferase [Salmonella enterica subsp. enterica serovar Anatum]
MRHIRIIAKLTAIINLRPEVNFDDAGNQQHRPRRLTPRECARLMGFEAPQTYQFRIPVSD